MLLKIIFLFLVLLIFLFAGSRILKKKITPYHPLTWSLVELFWYLISFAAVCIGLAELERIEKLNVYKETEKALTEDYYNKKNLLRAQVWILKIDSTLSKDEEEGVMWFHKMKAFFDEGLYTSRWEGFLIFSRNFIDKEPGARDASHAVEYGWPRDIKLKTGGLFLRDEIRWVTDSLNNFRIRKEKLYLIKPEENTNYRIRYLLIFFFLLGLSLKILKIYADYKKATGR